MSWTSQFPPELPNQSSHAGIEMKIRLRRQVSEHTGHSVPRMRYRGTGYQNWQPKISKPLRKRGHMHRGSGTCQEWLLHQ